uniref:Uncharacterized protein n=1 Tax=Cacopsylla melanoneura TaxID=428564 RepID=A0A8D8V9K6_9HEMI
MYHTIGFVEGFTTYPIHTRMSIFLSSFIPSAFSSLYDRRIPQEEYAVTGKLLTNGHIESHPLLCPDKSVDHLDMKRVLYGFDQPIEPFWRWVSSKIRPHYFLVN